MRTVGGTLASRICGLSKWGGPLSAYYLLVDESDGVPQSTAMRRGGVLEASVLALYGERDGMRALSGPGHIPGGMRLAPVSMPHAHATLDALAVPQGQEGDAGPYAILDAKTCGREAMGEEWGEDGSDVVPVEYAIQLQWYGGVARAAGLAVAEEMHLPTLIGWESELAWAARMVERTGRPLTMADVEESGLEFRVYRLRYDAEVFAALDAKVRTFLAEHVEPRRPPMPGPGDVVLERDMAAVAKGARAEPGRVLDYASLSEAERACVGELLDASRQRKAWEKQEAQARCRVQLAMGTAEEVAGCPGGARVTWKATTSGERRFLVKEPRG